MVISDYDRKKDLEVTSQNDSGSTISKSQPIIVTGAGSYQKPDTFEDGDFSSNPQWSRDNEGTAEVQQSIVKNGSYALRLDGGETLHYDRGSNGGLDAGDVYQSWIYYDDTNDSYYALADNVDVFGTNHINVRMSGNEADLNTSKSGSSNMYASLSTDTWYKVEFEIIDEGGGTYSVTGRIYDSSGTQLGSSNLGIDSANLQYVIMQSGPVTGGGGTTYYDDVSYSTERATDNVEGTGDVVIDWTNISSESDIAVYDSNNDVLPYEVESFDSTSESAVIWVYGSWARDDTVQAQLAYGNGPSISESVSGSGSDPWNQGQNALTVQHLQDNPITGTDSSPNGNDGTVNNVSSVTGEFDGSGEFNGSDSYVGDVVSNRSLDPELTHRVYFKTDSDHDGIFTSIWSNNDSNENAGLQFGKISSGEVEVTVSDGTSGVATLTSTSISNNEWHQAVITHDGSGGWTLYIDGDQVATDGLNLSLTSDLYIGRGYHKADDSFFWPLDGSLDEVADFQDGKSAEWVQADYDSSPTGGQVFFSQQAAEDTPVLIEGIVDLSGTAQSGVTVRLVNTSSDTYVGETTTDSNGFYQFTGLNKNDEYHVTAEYEDGSNNKYHGESKPFIDP